MFYYINEWLKWFSSYENGIKKDEGIPEILLEESKQDPIPEIPFEEPLPTQRIEETKQDPIPEIIPFEEPLPTKRIYKTGWKYK
jgi:hypothetical protein